MELPHDPVIPLVGIYMKRLKTLIRKNIWTPMFNAALFTIVKIWKLSRCSSIDEGIKKKLWFKKKQNCGTYTQWNITQL